MKTAEEILKECGCPDIPYDEMVTMHYLSILDAMNEYASQSQGNKDLIIEKQGEYIEALERYIKYPETGMKGHNELIEQLASLQSDKAEGDRDMDHALTGE